VRPQLHEIVRGGSSRAAQTVRRVTECFRQRRPCGTVERFQDRGFVQDNTIEVGNVERIQSLVIRDGNAVLYLARVPCVMRGNAEAGSLRYCLLSNSKGRQHQDAPFCGCHDLTRPFKLDRRLAQSAIGEHGSAPTTQRPRRYVSLKRKQWSGEV